MAKTIWYDNEKELQKRLSVMNQENIALKTEMDRCKIEMQAVINDLLNRLEIAQKQVSTGYTRPGLPRVNDPL